MRNLTGNINTATATLCPLLLYNILYRLKNNQYIQQILPLLGIYMYRRLFKLNRNGKLMQKV